MEAGLFQDAVQLSRGGVRRVQRCEGQVLLAGRGLEPLDQVREGSSPVDALGEEGRALIGQGGGQQHDLVQPDPSRSQRREEDQVHDRAEASAAQLSPLSEQQLLEVHSGDSGLAAGTHQGHGGSLGPGHERLDRAPQGGFEIELEAGLHVGSLTHRPGRGWDQARQERRVPSQGDHSLMRVPSVSTFVVSPVVRPSLRSLAVSESR